jgi:hypothetical protein
MMAERIRVGKQLEPPNGLGFSCRPCEYSFDKSENQFSKFQRS